MENYDHTFVASQTQKTIANLKRDFYANIDYQNTNIQYRQEYVNEFINKHSSEINAYYSSVYNANITKSMPLSYFDKMTQALSLVTNFLIRADGYDTHMFLNEHDL